MLDGPMVCIEIIREHTKTSRKSYSFVSYSVKENVFFILRCSKNLWPSMGIKEIDLFASLLNYLVDGFFTKPQALGEWIAFLWKF